jgi:uncharacterized protein YneF (UPF0154 family)
MLTTDKIIGDLVTIIILLAIGFFIYSKITKQSIQDVIKGLMGK